MKVNVGFIGAGNMGTAIMKGISGCTLSDKISLFAADPDASKVDSLAEYGVEKCSDAAEVVSKCKYVFLAVKPQVIEGVLKSISGSISENTVLISIAAGINSEFLRKATETNVKSVIVMPNTPLLLNEGASALAKDGLVSDEEFEFVCSIFRACGKAAVIDESKMKEVIAVNGSSPAFIYLFAKGFIDYASKVGINSETAKELFAQSLIGSAKMITDSGYSIDELIKMVSSPGGTTLAGLDKLYSGNLLDVVDSACEACTKRAYELAK
ncbi:pyrroline-5-carboxylate reductase [Porcipelethomonas sp.]|uniref:pyrroline-5-carboxylate reductase n=1 Tax=Porcipelethomonas sp. TaxID=2981675 RepID=UPI003EFA9168